MTASKTLNGWTPLTTRLLGEGGPSAWNVIDGAFGEEVCAGIQQELERSRVTEKLLPARTKGEAQADQILSLLKDLQDNSLPASSPVIRGDKSIFLSREIRSDPRFPERHPNLHRLIETLQQTLITHLSSRIQLDAAQTSVQLAVYPGDGQSGYVRHCDRGQEFCRDESSGGLGQVGRVITAIYYMTNDDWSATRDGGALRVFHSDNQSTDLVPYRDRLVVFRSDAIEHQVLPSLKRPRMAITLWFYGKILPDEQRQTALTTTPLSVVQPHLSKVETTEEPLISEEEDSSLTSEGPPPLSIIVPEGQTIDTSDTATIFVTIASFRDSETVPTLRSLFSQAHHPTRIAVGLVLQLDENQDTPIWSQLQDFIQQHYPKQIRYLQMAARDASGPCYARALCQSLHRGEDYVLQFDSHMRLRQNWDTYLIQQHQRLVNQRGDDRLVLTTYPIGYTLPNRVPNETRGTLLVPWKFDDCGLLRQRGRLMNPRTDPVPSPLIAAGFFFGPAQLLQDVPYDPNLHQLFFGEELSLAVRFYTHGYDGYAPAETVCYHLWSRAHRPTQQPLSASEKVQRKASMDVARKQLLGQKTPFQHLRYGLGSCRTVQDFAVALQVDFGERRFLRDDVENGALCSDDFVQSLDHKSLSLYSLDSLELKVTNLDPSMRQHISRFLGLG